MREGRELPLPPRVIGVLELLLERAGEVVPRQDLIDRVWKDAFVTDTSLAEAISVLRQALGDDSQAPTYIQTLHRRGYRFVAALSPASPGDSADARTAPAPLAPPAEVVSPSIAKELIPWSVAAICACVAAVAVWQLTTLRRPADAAAPRFEVTTAAGTELDAQAPSLAFSPDGRRLAWSACDDAGCRLYVRRLDRLDAEAVPGTDDARAPFFSPDGQWIGFFAEGQVKKVAVAGGAPIAVADAPAVRGAAWAGNQIIFSGSPTGGLMRVPADAGTATVLTVPREAEGEVGHSWPTVVPGTSTVLFTIESNPAGAAAGSVGAFRFDPRAPGPISGWRQLRLGAAIAAAPARDVIVFGRGSELAAVAFDPATLELSGTPRSVLDLVATASGRAQFAVSAGGASVWATPRPAANGAGASRLAWVAPPEGSEPLPSWSQNLHDVAASADGARIAGVNLDGPRSDVWVADIRRSAATRLTHDGTNAAPVWSADGRDVFYAARTGGVYEIWRRDAGGEAPPAIVFKDPAGAHHSFPAAASPDGQLLAFVRTTPAQRSDLWLLTLATGDVRPLAAGPFDENALAFSPDSKAVAFQSSDTGRSGIYVLRLADGQRTVVSTNGGERPLWTRDGLYFQAQNQLLRAAVAGDGSVGDVRVVAPRLGGSLRGIDAGGRVLVQRDRYPAGGTAIVSLDWLRGVRDAIGPPVSPLPR